MGISIIKGELIQCHTDAIVHVVNHSLLSGGADSALYQAAGPELYRACTTLGICMTGEAKITAGYRLPAKYVIHTPGPVWNGGGSHEAELLESCYRSCLELAEANGCRTVAFPSISTGVYHFPLEQAAEIAVRTILEYGKGGTALEVVEMVCFDGRTKAAYDAALAKMKER